MGGILNTKKQGRPKKENLPCIAIRHFIHFVTSKGLSVSPLLNYLSNLLNQIFSGEIFFSLG